MYRSPLTSFIGVLLIAWLIIAIPIPSHSAIKVRPAEPSLG